MSTDKENTKKYKHYLTRTERMCAHKERCQQDIKQRCVQWELPAAWVEKIITHLKNNNFINDRRFAQAFAKDKFAFNQWGKIKIKTQLRHKGIGNEIIEDALGEIDDKDYIRVLEKLLRLKWTTTVGSVYERKGKTARFLQSKGFEYHLILEALDKVETNETN
jgi:regulatory protein